MPFKDEQARRDYQREWRRKRRAAKRAARESASRTAEPVEPDLAPSAWAAKHVRLVGEGRGWSQPKHLRDLADVIGRPGNPHVVGIRKGAQLGYSVTIGAAIAHAVAGRGLRACLLLPTVSSARTWWRQRLLPIAGVAARRCRRCSTGCPTTGSGGCTCSSTTARASGGRDRERH